MKPEDVTDEMIRRWCEQGFYAVKEGDAAPLIAASVNAAGAIIPTEIGEQKFPGESSTLAAFHALEIQRLREQEKRYEELLEACKGLLDFIRAKYPEDFTHDQNNFTCPHHRAIAAAINKAEGGE